MFVSEVEADEDGFSELVYYTIPGYLSGLGVGFLLDVFGFTDSFIGNIFVRVLSGESESIFEGVYSIQKKVSRSSGSLSEAYGWGKLGGMILPILVHTLTWFSGISMTGVWTFYIPYFYGLSDQMGANISGLYYFYTESDSMREALQLYFSHPVMVSSLAILLFVPVVLFLARVGGFAPTTQVLAAVETIVANVCWVPPLIGRYFEQRN